MRPATLVAGSVVLATLGAADLGVLSIVVVPRWLAPEPAMEKPVAVASSTKPSALPISELPKPEPRRPESAKEAPKTEPPKGKVEVPEIDVSSPSEPSERPAEAPAKAAALTLQFSVDAVDLDDDARAQLHRFLSSVGPTDRLRVEGHADVTGYEEGNRYLSRERAKNVARELVRQGVDESRIASVGFGSSRPLVAGRSSTAYDRNRRVELFLERSGR